MNNCTPATGDAALSLLNGIFSSVLYKIAEPDEGPDWAETSQLCCVVQCRDCEVLL